jgi:hypothetical protein
MRQAPLSSAGALGTDALVAAVRLPMAHCGCCDQVPALETHLTPGDALADRCSSRRSQTFALVPGVEWTVPEWFTAPFAPIRVTAWRIALASPTVALVEPASARDQPIDDRGVDLDPHADAAMDSPPFEL